MTDSTAQTCESCRFAVPAYGLHCRRYPPTPTKQVTFDGSGMVDYDYLHPFVAPDHWCGEWKAKP